MGGTGLGASGMTVLLASGDTSLTTSTGGAGLNGRWNGRFGNDRLVRFPGDLFGDLNQRRRSQCRERGGNGPGSFSNDLLTRFLGDYFFCHLNRRSSFQWRRRGGAGLKVSVMTFLLGSGETTFFATSTGGTIFNGGGGQEPAWRFQECRSYLAPERYLGGAFRSLRF